MRKRREFLCILRCLFRLLCHHLLYRTTKRAHSSLASTPKNQSLVRNVKNSIPKGNEDSKGKSSTAKSHNNSCIESNREQDERECPADFKQTRLHFRFPLPSFLSFFSNCLFTTNAWIHLCVAFHVPVLLILKASSALLFSSISKEETTHAELSSYFWRPVSLQMPFLSGMRE